MIILNLEVYSACDGIIDLFYPVGRKEHDPLLILEGSEEHTNEGISVDVADGALLEKKIRLV